MRQENDQGRSGFLASAVDVEVALSGLPATDRKCDNAVQRRAWMLPRLADLPVPENVQSDASIWGEQMLEMADHIGPFFTLVLCDRFGGQQVNIPARAELNPFREVLGDELSRRFTHVYQRCRLSIPRAKQPIEIAKRAGVIAAVREGLVSGADAAAVIGTSRTYMAHLVNHTSEGVGVAPTSLPLSREAALLITAANLVEAALVAWGAAETAIEAVRERLLGLSSADNDVLRRSVDQYVRPTRSTVDTPTASALLEGGQ